MKIASRAIAAFLMIAGLAAPAMAGNTTLWSSTKGDIVLPISPPTNSGATPGRLDNTVIGATTPATGTFSALTSTGAIAGPVSATTLSASGAVSLNPASAAVTLSPTGTGTVTINPATASTMDNVAIGGTTPKNGGFLALTATYVTATSFINISTATALTAAGTTIADALQLTKAINNVTTAGLNSGVILPNAATVGEGGTVIIYDNGANPIKVYSSDATIDGTAGSTGVTLTNAKRCAYTVIGGNFVSAQLGAVSG